MKEWMVMRRATVLGLRCIRDERLRRRNGSFALEHAVGRA